MSKKFKILAVVVLLVVSFSTISTILSMNFVETFNSVENVHSNLSDLYYFDLINDTFNLTSDELNLLELNQFIVLNRFGSDDILDMYSYYWHHDLPIIITTDSMLQVWHLIFDKLLEKLEQDILYPIFKQFTLNLFYNFTENFDLANLDTEMVTTLLFLTVGAKLADSNVMSPEIVRVDVNTLLTAIYQENDVFKAIENLQSNYTKRFIDDFTMYKPRGHYTHSYNLTRYFRLYKWFSRIPFFFSSYPGYIYLDTTPEQMIKSTIFLSYLMANTQVRVPRINIDANGIDIWSSMIQFFDKLFGKTNAITPINIIESVSNIIGNSNWAPQDITDSDINQIKDVILNDEAVPDPKDNYLIDALNPEACIQIMIEQNKDVCSPKTFHLFGEMLMPDTFVTNHLVAPYVMTMDSAKYFPTGLEFASVILNSEDADKYLGEIFSTAPFWDIYATQLANMKNNISSIPSEEKDTLTWGLYDSLSQLTNPITSNNVPAFFQSSPWKDEKLTTVLSSWAQLKHDSLLYAKQGLSFGGCSTPEGYVEPYPEFYNHLNQVNLQFKDSITQFQAIGLNVSSWRDPTRFEPEDKAIYLDVFDNFSYALNQLETISLKEINGLPLSEQDKAFINETYSIVEFSGGCAGFPGNSGWLGTIIDLISHDMQDLTPDSTSSGVGDIHTCVSDYCQKTSLQVLEVSTGYLEHLIAIVPTFNGSKMLAVGSVLSYYEFVLPIEHRMTDKDWKAVILSKQNETLSGNLDYSIFQRGFWSQSYMVSNGLTYDAMNKNYVLEEAKWEGEIYGAEWFTGLHDPHAPSTQTDIPGYESTSQTGDQQVSTNSFIMRTLPYIALVSPVAIVVVIFYSKRRNL